MLKCLPKIGEKYYFMNSEIIVLKVWDCFHIAKIRNLADEKPFYVDFCALSLIPNSNFIPLKFFGGV